MTALLAVDTSTTAVTVALARFDGEPVARSVLDARAHTEVLAPLVRDLLAEAGVTASDLTGIAVGTGPGPFTGLRVGLVTAVTMGHALGVPVHGVCSLDALAEQVFADPGLDAALVATDARRREVYWARYRRGPQGPVALDEPAVSRPADLLQEARNLPTAGRGPLLHPQWFPVPLGRPLDVDAAWLARVCRRRLVAGISMPAEPRYLRRPDALTSAERAAR